MASSGDGARLCPQDQPQRVRACCGWASPEPRSVTKDPIAVSGCARSNSTSAHFNPRSARCNPHLECYVFPSHPSRIQSSRVSRVGGASRSLADVPLQSVRSAHTAKLRAALWNWRSCFFPRPARVLPRSRRVPGGGRVEVDARTPAGHRHDFLARGRPDRRRRRASSPPTPAPAILIMERGLQSASACDSEKRRK